jgi:hypothetical protein
MITFLYEDDHPTPETDTNAHLTHTKVYILADKYDVPPLKELTTDKFLTAVLDDPKSASFAASLKLMFDQLPESDRLLKDSAIKATATQIKAFWRSRTSLLCSTNMEILALRCSRNL